MIEGMVPLEEAQQIILGHVAGPLAPEDVGIIDSLGRVLAQDHCTDIDLAPFDNTAMDGFAMRSADVASASENAPVELRIVGHIGAGFTFEKALEQGQAVRIMTGAPIPKGADAVEQVEKVSWTGKGGVGDTLRVGAPVKSGQNIRLAAEEAHEGDVVLAAGTVMTPAGVGLLASAGHATATVYSRPRVGIISLGSELVGVCDKPKPGQIRNSNAYSLAAEVCAAGCIPHIYPTEPDDFDAIRSLVSKACGENDFVLSSGGASGGDFDYISQVAGALGEVEFTLVRMKPGKSQTFAMIGGTPFLGLAGNPTAAELGFEMLARPALRKMQGYSQLFRASCIASLAEPARRRGPRRFYLRGRIERDEAGKLVAHVEGSQSSALLGPLAQATCLIALPEDKSEFAARDEVECLRIDLPEGSVL